MAIASIAADSMIIPIMAAYHHGIDGD